MKKFLITAVIFSLTLLSFFSFSFAATDLVKDAQNATNAIGKGLTDTSNNAKNAIQKGENKIENGVTSAKNTIVDSTRNATNGIANMGNNTVGYVANTNMNTNYNATRTAANNNFLGMTSANWTWVILAVVGVAIVGLVWYYGAQYEHSNYSDGE